MFLDDLYHSLDPVAFSLGPLTVRWYGLAYLAGFVLCGILLYRIARRWKLDLTSDDVLNVMTGICLGIIVGGRLGYVLFYGAGYYLADPLRVFAFNEGGMSFHGGLVGAVIGGVIVCKRTGISVATMCDLGACVAPLGLFFGRLANFVNGELWGKECDLPWGVMFETGGNVYRHPSQLCGMVCVASSSSLFACLTRSWDICLDSSPWVSFCRFLSLRWAFGCLCERQRTRHLRWDTSARALL